MSKKKKTPIKIDGENYEFIQIKINRPEKEFIKLYHEAINTKELSTVITYINNEKNKDILNNIARHLKSSLYECTDLLDKELNSVINGEGNIKIVEHIKNTLEAIAYLLIMAQDKLKKELVKELEDEKEKNNSINTNNHNSNRRINPNK